MTADAFSRCHAVTAKHEGGYVNHPKDPGGATNFGITQRVYDAWRASRGQATRSVRAITQDEVMAICRSQYWDAIRGDRMPPGIDLVTYDWAVNSGPSRAVRALQAALSVRQDGVVGNVTLQAAREAFVAGHAEQVIARVSDARLRFKRGLSIWPTFGRGWTRRIDDVERRAREMARAAFVSLPATETRAPTVYRPERATAPAEPARQAARGGTLAAAATAVAAGATAAREAIPAARETLGLVIPAEWAAAIALGALLIGVAAGLYAAWRARQADRQADDPKEKLA